jgi:hypothetical protein
MGNAMGGAMQGMPGMGGMMAAGGRPSKRNAILLQLIPIIVNVVVNIIVGVVNSVAESGVVAMIMGLLSLLVSLGLFVWIILTFKKMTGEMNSVTGNAAFPWWPVFIPIYNLYWLLILVPQEMAKAKQMAGAQRPSRNMFIYFLFPLYAFAADLNDMSGQ